VLFGHLFLEEIYMPVLDGILVRKSKFWLTVYVKGQSLCHTLRLAFLF
jgi:hypothetical protein